MWSLRQILDGDGRQVDSLTSNIGHLLWSGIVDEEKAKACVHHLMSDQLFSGWGIRTMAEGEGGYNPLGYHIGTVWPHDNSLIALGLRRYGYDEEAAHIALGMLEAARFFEGRLPEAFAGYPRKLTGFPVEYPTAAVLKPGRSSCGSSCCPKNTRPTASVRHLRSLVAYRCLWKRKRCCS